MQSAQFIDTSDISWPLFEVPAVPREPNRMEQECTSAFHGDLARSLISIQISPFVDSGHCAPPLHGPLWWHADANDITPHYIHWTQTQAVRESSQ